MTATRKTVHLLTALALALTMLAVTPPAADARSHDTNHATFWDGRTVNVDYFRLEHWQTSGDDDLRISVQCHRPVPGVFRVQIQEKAGPGIWVTVRTLDRMRCGTAATLYNVPKSGWTTSTTSNRLRVTARWGMYGTTSTTWRTLTF